MNFRNPLGQVVNLIIWLEKVFGKGSIQSIDLNHLSPVLGIPVATAMEALDTSNSRFPTLVLRP
jgi:hypothetical protein